MFRVQARFRGQDRVGEILFHAIAEKCMRVEMSAGAEEYREARDALKSHLLNTSVLNNDFPNEERLEAYLRRRDFYFC